MPDVDPHVITDNGQFHLQSNRQAAESPYQHQKEAGSEPDCHSSDPQSSRHSLKISAVRFQFVHKANAWDTILIGLPPDGF
jgi:hypothetical protein